MKKRGGKTTPDGRLFPQPEFGNQRSVTFDVLIFQVVEQIPSFTDHLKQTSAAVMVFFVNGKMLGQLGNAFGEKRDLDFGRTGIAFAAGALCDQFGLFDFFPNNNSLK